MDDIHFPRDLFDLLVCPASRSPLKLINGSLVCTDGDCRRKYSITDGIPILLIEESIILDAAAWRAGMAIAGPVSGSVPVPDGPRT
jgi:uncharacterized protein YbaR (Trm112 family)